MSSKGKPLITKARLETVWTRLADRFSTEVADTSMIIISPEYAGYFYEAPAYRTLQCLPVPRTRDSDSQSTNSCRRGRHIHVPCGAGGVVRPGPSSTDHRLPPGPAMRFKSSRSLISIRRCAIKTNNRENDITLLKCPKDEWIAPVGIDNPQPLKFRCKASTAEATKLWNGTKFWTICHNLRFVNRLELWKGLVRTSIHVCSQKPGEDFIIES